jgi:hypothetical protein
MLLAKSDKSQGPGTASPVVGPVFTRTHARNTILFVQRTYVMFVENACQKNKILRLCSALCEQARLNREKLLGEWEQKVCCDA